MAREKKYNLFSWKCMYEFFNETIGRFQDLMKRKSLTNVSISFPASLEPVNDTVQLPPTTEHFVTLYIFPMGFLISHGERFSSPLYQNVSSCEFVLHDIEHDTEAYRVNVSPDMDDVFLQQHATLTLEAADEHIAKIMEDFYTPRFHRVIMTL